MLSLSEIEKAAAIVHGAMLPTPQHVWPLLAARTGCEIWVKHENHTPIGAFKVRGGLVYLERLKQRAPDTKGVISATRGNHGQSIALAARRAGIAATIVVPHGNSREKNAAMRAFGSELVEAGHDFDAAKDAAMRLAGERGLTMVPSFHHDLVAGVASYALELMRAAPPLDTIYVPIGLGSGICGCTSPVGCWQNWRRHADHGGHWRLRRAARHFGCRSHWRRHADEFRRWPWLGQQHLGRKQTCQHGAGCG